MTKILYISPSAQLGGAERSLLDILSVMKCHTDFEVEVLLFEDGPLCGELDARQVPRHIVELPKSLAALGDTNSLIKKLCFPLVCLIQFPILFTFLKSIRNRVGNPHIQIIHTNGNKAHILAAIFKTKHQKLIWHLREYLRPKSISRQLLIHLSSRCFSIVSNSKSVAKEVLDSFNCESNQTIYNAIDHPKKFNFKSPVKVFALVATYANWKGHFLFIDAIAKIKDFSLEHNLKFKIIGGPIYQTKGSQLSREEIRQYIVEKQIEDLIEIVNFVSNPDDLYSQLDVVINASTQPEPFGRTIIEGLLRSKPVIAPNNGGPREILGNPPIGFLFEPNSANELSSCIKKVSQFDELENFAKKSYEYALTHFTYESLESDLLQLYKAERANQLFKQGA